MSKAAMVSAIRIFFGHEVRGVAAIHSVSFSSIKTFQVEIVKLTEN